MPQPSGVLSSAAPEETVSQKPVSARLAWIDIFRGIAIIAVVLIHITSRLLHHAGPGSKTWMCFALVNRGAQFAVPGFLLLSAMVNTSSLLRRFDLKRFYTSRLGTILWPYLLWSAIYIVYLGWPNVSSLDYNRAWQQVLLGKAYPHLYFLWVLIQLLAPLPLFVLIMRRKPPFWLTALAAILLTAAFYVINRRLTYQYPDLVRSVLDYIPASALGIWIGSRAAHWQEILAKGWPAAAVVTGAGAAIYLPLAIQSDLLNRSVDSLHYQAAWWAYTAGASFLLLFLGGGIDKFRSVSVVLQHLGRYSMQIYLAHPFMLLLIDAHPEVFKTLGLWGTLLVYVGSALAGPLLLAEVCTRLRLSPLLFGR